MPKVEPLLHNIIFVTFNIDNKTYPRIPLIIWSYMAQHTCRLLRISNQCIQVLLWIKQSSKVLSTTLFIYFSASTFCAAKSNQASKADWVLTRVLKAEKLNREIQMTLPKKPCKMTSISFSLRARLMVAAVFPKLTHSWRKADCYFLAQAPLLSVVALYQ